MNAMRPMGSIGDPAPAGKVRAVRITDLAAVGDLSRFSHTPDGRDGSFRSLGLPVSAGPFSVFSLFRLPLGAFQPNDQLYVYEEEGRIAGLLRVERDGHRDEWTIVELDAIGRGEAGDIRFRLVQHLLRDGTKRGAGRFHVACADRDGNVELFMQSGFARYGEERILYRPPERRLPAPLPASDAVQAGIRPVQPLDALQLSRLYSVATPQPVARLEAYRLPDWERQGNLWRVPRSSLAPILRFADVDAFVQEAPEGDGLTLAGFLQVGVAKEEQPHYLKVIVRPNHDAAALVSFGLGIIGERTAGAKPPRGVVSPVRTYESPLDRRLEEADFSTIATVSLLMKETLVRVAEPALVPAIR